MANRIISNKEFRESFRKEIAAMSDFSPSGRKTKHVLGIGARQIVITTGVEVARKLIDRIEGDGRTLDKDMIDLRTPRGLRRYVSSQLNSMASVRIAHGANPIETAWKTLGDLIIIARRGRENVYVGKSGATRVELDAFVDLRSGKLHAAAERNELIRKAAKDAAKILAPGEFLADKYAETVTESFKAVAAE